MDNEIRGLIKRLDELEKMHKTIIQNLRHDWITPVGGVVGLAEGLSNLVTDPEQLELINMIRDSGHELMCHVTDILSMIEALESDEKTIDEYFNLNQLASSLERMFLAQFYHNSNEHVFEMVDAPESVIGDRQKLERALMAIIGNAAKFTKNGKISVIFYCHAVDEHMFNLQVDVTDTGIGMMPEDFVD